MTSISAHEHSGLASGSQRHRNCARAVLT